MGVYYKEEFKNVGEALELETGKASKIVFQWRRNTTTGKNYLSIAKRTTYATMENGKAVEKQGWRGNLVIPEEALSFFLDLVKQMEMKTPSSLMIERFKY